MKEIKQAFLVFLVMTLLTGLAYPFAVTYFCQRFFPEQANGSVVTTGGAVIGSALVGQKFTRPEYFHGRPSANEYGAGNSGGTNFGPSNAKHLEEVGRRAAQIRKENDLDVGAPIPADLVLASASGLDPDVSLEAVLIQAPRVAKARHLPEAQVRSLIAELTGPPFLGLTGQDSVNVLKLNLALDALTAEHR